MLASPRRPAGAAGGESSLAPGGSRGALPPRSCQQNRKATAEPGGCGAGGMSPAAASWKAAARVAAFRSPRARWGGIVRGATGASVGPALRSPQAPARGVTAAGEDRGAKEASGIPACPSAGGPAGAGQGRSRFSPGMGLLALSRRGSSSRPGGAAPAGAEGKEKPLPGAAPAAPQLRGRRGGGVLALPGSAPGGSGRGGCWGPRCGASPELPEPRAETPREAARVKPGALAGGSGQDKAPGGGSQSCVPPPRALPPSSCVRCQGAGQVPHPRLSLVPFSTPAAPQ